MEIQNLGSAIASMAQASGLEVANSANYFAIGAPSIPDGVKTVTILKGCPEPVVSRDKVSLQYPVLFDGKAEGFLSKNFIFGGSYAAKAGRVSLRDLKSRVEPTSLTGKFSVETTLIPGKGNINVAVFNEDVKLNVSILKHPAVPTANSYDAQSKTVLCEQSNSESYAILA